jgi:hypothetical protein
MRRLAQLMLLVCPLLSAILTYGQTTGGPLARPAVTNNQVSRSSLAACLPPGIKLSDVVEATSARIANGQPVGLDKVTVEQRLGELKATCSSDNKLIDGSGKQIVFYHLTGCWGNPPARADEILRKQREELDKLKQQYTVIEMTCNPSGTPIS